MLYIIKAYNYVETIRSKWTWYVYVALVGKQLESLRINGVTIKYFYMNSCTSSIHNIVCVSEFTRAQGIFSMHNLLVWLTE